MKKQLYLVIAATLMSFSSFGQIDSVIIFQPGPGVNDSTDQGGLNGGKDAYVHEGAPGTNFANVAAVEATPISNCNQTHMQSFLQFDLTSLPDTVDSVFIGFRHIDQLTYCLSNCVADFYFAAITQQWYEQEVNYGNKPTIDTPFYGPITLAFPDTGSVREYNITDMYNLWKAGTIPNYGLAVHSTTVGCNNACILFYAYSSDDTAAANRPYLKIHFTVDTSTTTSVENTLAAKMDLKAYPNPAVSELNLSFTTTEPGNVSYAITDLMGRTMIMEKQQMTSGRQQLKISTGALAPGMYCFRLSTTSGTIVQKFIKQ